MKSHKPQTLWSLILYSVLAIALASAAASAPAAWYAADDTGRTGRYQSGQAALDEARWSDAAEIFGQIVAEGGKEEDAALYWQAYALVKRGRDRQALSLLETIEKKHASSRWLDDARALQLEIRQKGGEKVTPASLEDEELQLYAVNSLMNADPERAVPVLEKLLASDRSTEIKTRALFVLSQADSPRARAILLDSARSSDAELAEQAIQYLGLCDECGPELRELYTSTDTEVRGAVLEAMMLSDDVEGLLHAAENEQDLELRSSSIELLGMVEATDELRRLYENETSTSLKRDIIEALFLADDDSTLAAIAETDADPELRLAAIEALGLVDTSQSSRVLHRIYENESSMKVKEEIIDALFLSDEVDFLAEIARQDPEPRLQRAAIDSLGLIDDDESGQVLVALYGEKSDFETRESILEALFLQDNAEALIDIFRAEKEPRLRKKALESLSLIDSDEAVEFLIQTIDG